MSSGCKEQEWRFVALQFVAAHGEDPKHFDIGCGLGPCESAVRRLIERIYRDRLARENEVRRGN